MLERLSALYPQIDFKNHSAVTTCNRRFRPIMLTVETVNICNNDCIICAYSSQTRAKKTMSLDLFRKIIQDYSDMGGGPLSLTPVVGDAFLDKHLARRIEIVREFPNISSISIVTNAVMTNLREERDLPYILANLNQIYISIYGADEEEYELMTQKKTYGKMIEGIRRILDSTDAVVLLGFRLLKDRSQDALGEWVANVKQGTRYRNEITYGSVRDYANWSVMDTSKALPFGARWMSTPNNQRQCAIPLFACQVLVNGSVSFCSCPNFDDDKQLSLGNVADKSLLDILNGERSESLWNWAEEGVPNFCRTCSFHAPIDVMPDLEFIYGDPVRQIGG